MTTLFCCASLLLSLRKVVSAAIGYAVDPATKKPKAQLCEAEEKGLGLLRSNHFKTQKLTLQKSGISYDATLIYHPDFAWNGQWSIHALGNAMTIEENGCLIALKNRGTGLNTLLINGPSVGRSSGFPTRYQMGAGFEAGLQFLEKEIKATHIVVQGFSLGGGMMAEAIASHQFTPEVHYLGVFDRTVASLSKIRKICAGSAASVVCSLTGTELDTVAGVEKLKKLQIKHVIVQHEGSGRNGTDGVIPDRVSLATSVAFDETRTFLCSELIDHNQDLPLRIEQQLKNQISEFLLGPEF